MDTFIAANVHFFIKSLAKEWSRYFHSVLYRIHHLQAYAVIGLVNLVRILAQFSSPSEEVCNATSNLIQAILNGITDLEQFREDKAKHETHKQKTGTPHGSKFKPLSLSMQNFLSVEILDISKMTYWPCVRLYPASCIYPWDVYISTYQHLIKNV